MIRDRDLLISPDYLSTQVVLHSDPRGYGGRGKKWADTVRWLMAYYRVGSVLDYGCGQASLSRELGSICRDYDPAIPGKDALPSFADLVVCTDVLEHIEPDRLSAVLGHIRSLARRAAFLVVALVPSNKTLLTGGNAHIILESSDWWAERVTAEGFSIQTLPELPIPGRLNEKRHKFWIAVVTP